jgi:Zn-dependent protease with chaperone function
MTSNGYQSGGDSIPMRSELIERIQRANRLAVPWILIQLALAIVLATGIQWNRILDEPLITVVAVLVIVGPHIMGVLRHYALNKREIGDLKEETKFGEFDKYRLRSLMDATLDRLDLPRPGPPVYITADKALNAGALHLGLGGFFRSLNGVYLNRQILHRLTPAEVQDVIGHELGHFYRYYLLSERFRGLTLVLGACGALLVTQWIGMSSVISLFALWIFGTAIWVVSGWLIARNAMSIEYLCDDFGAQVHGVVVSINGLLKVGVDGEMQLAIHQQELSSRRHGNLNARDVVESIEAAIPYGHTSREELERAVADSLKRRSQDRRKLSVAGFIDYAWNGDDDSEEVEELVTKIKRVQKVPRLNWESLLDRPGRIELNERQVEHLIELMAANPHEVLFHSPEELGDTDGVHPPIRSRILYLWFNREEIAAASRQRF